MPEREMRDQMGKILRAQRLAGSWPEVAVVCSCGGRDCQACCQRVLQSLGALAWPARKSRKPGRRR